MNISAQIRRPTLSAVGKGKLLPTKKTVIIPAGLDWEIKTKLNSVLARTAKGIFSTRSLPEDLKNLAQQLGQSINDNPYPVELYGHEIGVLYVFLGEQEQWLDIWWPNAERPLMHRFLRQLKDTLWAVDVYASRPISGIG